MGELSNDGGMIMMNEDCSGEDITHPLIVQERNERNGSPIQSYSFVYLFIFSSKINKLYFS